MVCSWESTPDPILIPAILTCDLWLPPNHFLISQFPRLFFRFTADPREERSGARCLRGAVRSHNNTPVPRKKDCFWHNTPMRRETQVNLLGLIQRVCRIYQASTVTVMSNRGLIAARSTTFGCAVCIADSISR